MNDFKGNQSLKHEFNNHNQITKEDIKKNIFHAILKSGQKLPDALGELLKWKVSLLKR